MKKILLVTFIFIVSFVQGQNFETIDKLQNSSIASLKVLAGKLVNLTDKKFEFYKEKETSEHYLLVYIPVGLSSEEKEESRVNRYENGIIFKLSKTDKSGYKLKEFYVEPKIMFAIVNSVFYPVSNDYDFINSVKYRNYIDKEKGYNFYFYSGDLPKNKFRFYSY